MGGLEVGAAFADALERQRDTFNARFAETRRRHRGLDPANFKQYLIHCVDPTVQAAADAGFDGLALDRLVSALYRIALDLVALELAGPGGRHPIVAHAWRELLPRTVEWLQVGEVRDPIAALTNACLNLSVERSVDADEWLSQVGDAIDHVDSFEQLLVAGQVHAWLLGMAHFREGAMAVLDKLPAELVERFAETRPALTARWPDRGMVRLGLAANVGDFVGFDGEFVEPPHVCQVDGQLFAYDSRSCWTIHADRYGATLRRFGVAAPHGSAAAVSYVWSDRISVSHRYQGEFELEATALTVAAADELAVYTLPHSHRVYVVAPVEM